MSEFIDDHKFGEFGIDLDTMLHLTDVVVANEFNLLAGTCLGKHVHDYSHLSILSRGSVQLEKFHAGEDIPFSVAVLESTDKAVVVTVEANIYHRITAIKNAQWFCIHGEI